MSYWSSRRANDTQGNALSPRNESSRSRRCRGQDSGFTLIELLIVVTIMPMIVGALGAGLLAAFSLQSGVANRLSNTADAQVVSANFANDVESAAFVTTETPSTPQCGSGNQLLGLEWNYDATSKLFQTMVSYVSVPEVSGSITTWSLVRRYCTLESTSNPVNTTISYNLPSSQATPVVICYSTCDPQSNWIPASGVTSVTFSITEVKGTVGQQGTDTYQYTLEAVPQASSGTILQLGSPINNATSTGCGFATPGSGTYAPNLCLVDFSALTGNNLLAAEQGGSAGCLEMTATLPGNYQLYFCVKISGAPLAPSALPTYTDAFLGNTNSNGVPFYIGIPSDPALYQSCEGYNVMSTLVAGTNIENCFTPNVVSPTNPTGTSTDPSPAPTGTGITTVTFSNITVNNPQGIPATGWQVVSADAESSDARESLQWTSDKVLALLPNSSTSPYGNACGGGLTGAGTTTVTCTGYSNGQKTGAAMVVVATPNTLIVQGTGTGLEGFSFGLLLS